MNSIAAAAMNVRTDRERDTGAAKPRFACKICDHATDAPNPADLGTVRGNSARFLDRRFHLWRCPVCRSIHSIDAVDFANIYADYPLNKRRLDVFARGTLRHLLQRLRREGLRHTDAILDYGCGNGIFIRYLKGRGYRDVSGYDPYVPEYARLPAGNVRRFDCVVANDVIEHVADPRAMVEQCAALIAPGGLLYIGTADAAGVDMADLEPEIMRLHQPFHRVIVTQERLERLGIDSGLELARTYRRSYMDTLLPFSNYRFLDEFNRALGHNLDRALDPSAGAIVVRQPRLLFFAFFGYFFPVAYEPAIVLRKRA